ncbi:ABC transporter permease [Kamptonema animale CS-326]|jgi:putative ABC transport system permease protein|uniref:ABC transporter permease n=1 Tax=Kamptonema animale TaxID=92934 RepID=UPI002330D689|nr:ABC transporter permease [Kamptonema animale]MDB9510740.1 ABC transporter permease [Kamptonema animale CS-326]
MSLSPIDLLRLTCLSLSGNILRSVLTTVGVFMGVAAVSATLQVGSISRAVIAKQLAEREAPQLSIYVWDEEGGLKLEDMEFLRQRLKGIQAISTSNWFGFNGNKVVFQAEEAEPSMNAVSQDYLLTSGRQLMAGRFFSPTDFADYRPVVVIDELLAEKLFKGDGEPVNKRIYSGNLPYIIVGVMESKQPSYGEPKGEMLVSMSVYKAMTGSQRIQEILVRPYNLKDIKGMEKQAKKVLKQRFPKAEIYVSNNVKKILDQQETLELSSRGLLAVGVISLLVGGIGIANITIAAVTERTPEIGLRRAIGATQHDIMLQFILEAVILSLVGGIAAIVTVHGLTTVVADVFKLPYKFDSHTAALALGSALAVGVGAGFLPALRASQLDPVKALRQG